LHGEEIIPEAGRRATFKILQTIFRHDTMIARAEVELCLIDEKGRPARPSLVIARALGAG
ncbi:MAG: hypothetical protein AAFW98_04045, partial [Pseudomonadota bacterium]